MRKIFIAIVSAAFTMAVMTSLQACQKDEGPVAPEFAVSLSPENVLLSYFRGEVNLNIAPSDTKYSEIKWTLDPLSVAEMQYTSSDETMSTGVRLIPHSAGTATLTAAVTVIQDGLSTVRTATASVTVAEAYVKTSPMSLMSGSEADIEVTTNPSGMQDYVSEWTSSAPEVASVDAKGHVKALKSGTAKMTATFIDQPLEVTVTVSDDLFQINDLYATPSTCEVTWSLKTAKTYTEKGLCWCEGDGPATVDDNVLKAVSGGDEVKTVIEGLSEYTGYAVRLYYRNGDEVVYGAKSTFTTSKEKWAYNDEYGVTWYGIEINGFVWAPVPCGYKALDESGKGYPYGKLYQMGRKQGQGRGEAVWDDPNDHTKGGHFTDENGMTVKLVYGHCNTDDTKADEFYFNDTPFWYTHNETEPTEEEVNNMWTLNGNWEEGGHQFNTWWDTDPCPEGWRTCPAYDGGLVYSEMESFCIGDRIILTAKPYDECAQGIWFDTSVGGYRSPDGEIHTVAKDNSYQKIWSDHLSLNYRPWNANSIKSSSHTEMTPDGPKYFKTYNGASAMSVRCVCSRGM